MPKSSPTIRRIPKGTLKKLTLGQSFAEYDKILEKDNVFVDTPAIRAARSVNKSKCFFVGRRGTGKTAITLLLQREAPKNTLLLLPQLLTPIERFFEIDSMQDVHHQPFKSLVSSFKRALLDEVLLSWIAHGQFAFRHTTPSVLLKERPFLDEVQFDIRLLQYAESILEYLTQEKPKEWLREINLWKELGNEMDRIRDKHNWNTYVLIDRIDESWDGSDKAVVLLMALMHACVELTTAIECVQPLVFLRENVFERVRQIDKEFSRLETFVISLEWTRELLIELVERRLNVPLIAKFPLHGPTWEAFFEDSSGTSSQDLVFNYCQYRPRDVLTYCSFAIESAQSRGQERIMLEDCQVARKRFSDSRLKDLCDEYADNYPQLQLVLGRFYGLGREFTIRGIDDFIKKLLVDDEVKEQCKRWIYRFTQPDVFVKLLYEIGFVGIREDNKLFFRSVGPESSTTHGIGTDTSVVIHPSYADALNLQDVIVNSLDATVTLKESGLIGDLPGGIPLNEYQQKLASLREQFRTLPDGEAHASDFENLVGEVIKLCFYRVLTNVEPKVRTIDNKVIRDWIVANHASDGFWELIRDRYGATQIIWECKNYTDLTAGDFHQAAYYMTEPIGHFAILCYRGEEKKKSYYEHIRRIASEKNGIVLLFHEKDLDVFLRRAMNGKSNEGHLREIYDRTVREIS